MKSEDEVYALQDELISIRASLPSFETIPFDEEFGEKNQVVGAFKILSDVYEGTTIIIKNITMDGNMLSIDWNAVNAEDKVIDDKKLGKIIGKIINFTLIEKTLQDTV